jgi:hypothetical protein
MGLFEKLSAHGGGHKAFLKSLPAYVRQPKTTVNNFGVGASYPSSCSYLSPPK